MPLPIHITQNLKRFYSLFNAPGSSGVDAFSFNWKDEMCLLVPPVCIVGRVLRHLRLCGGKGVLICPLWPSAHYWPMLKHDFQNEILSFLRLKGSIILEHGYNTNSLLGSLGFKGDMVALLLDCSQSSHSF